jgi:hypothetical protein
VDVILGGNMENNEDIKRLENLIGFVGCDIRQIEADSIERVLSRLKTAERMNDVLAEQNVKSCEWYFSEFDNYTKDDFIEWARKKVEENV